MGLFRKLFARRRGDLNAGDLIQRGVLSVALVLLAAMTAVAILLALAGHDGGAGVTAFVLFVAGAAAGATLGFLFGLPRARVADLPPDGSDPAPAAKASTYYLTNSNLIKVSDWLTTIVIGLGLVNLDKAVPAMRTLANTLAAPLGNRPYSGVIGLCVLVVGVLAGFILTYLWTSIRVRELLEEAEQQTASPRQLASPRRPASQPQLASPRQPAGPPQSANPVD